ncbi:LOW QUALITY PROTEIN: uncharacterized protein kif25 [Anableps anableps]
MLLFINRDQIVAHQVHLREHNLRNKMENAILHLRLAGCAGKLHREHEEDKKQLQRKIFMSSLVKLQIQVQTVKQVLSEVLAVYVSFASELEEQSKQLLQKIKQTKTSLNDPNGKELQIKYLHGPQHSTDELIVSPASSTCPSPSFSPCPSPRNSISAIPFRTKLQLVDLAGSKCVDMTGVGVALWEVLCINRSLSALSDVLGALPEQRPHVPYRNNKLTHLLQDVIGGDAKLLVMLCVSPTQRFVESLQSFAFGTRAREVQKQRPQRRTNNLKLK